MPSTHVVPQSPKVFKPGRFSFVHYYWGVCSTAAAALFLTQYPRSGLPAVAGGIGLIIGIAVCLSTRSVMRTWYSVSPEMIGIVTRRWHHSLRWDELQEIVIRERRGGLIPGRPDRQVVVRGPGELYFAINTSVFSGSEERDFLARVEKLAECPIRKLQDGPLTARTWK